MTSSSRDFLLEIGTEEIPSGYIPSASLELRENFIELTKKWRLKFVEIKEFSTPRRLAILVQKLEERQETITEETIGPPEKIAFDENGNPTKAAIGFARNQGVDVKELKIKDTERGKYVVAIKQIYGEKTEKILPQIIPELIQSLHFPKSMRWGSNSFRFVRPVQWILALYGKKQIICEIAGLRTVGFTYGHRFMAGGPIKIKEPSEYVNKLRTAYCIVDREERKEFLRKQLEQISKKCKVKIIYSEELFSTVIDLVEFPVPVVCNIPSRFMSLPEKVMTNVLNEQQKFFTTADNKGRLTSKFIAVSNIKPKSINVLRTGYERVVSARLADADFFFQEDIKTPLSARLEKLKQLIFLDKAGSYYDKTIRLESIVRELAQRINPDVTEKVARSAHLCKADLTTHMVSEFPKLQGVMGMEYARHSGEDMEVARAIYEHYLPAFSGDELPETLPGIILSIADKMDNIVAGFALGYVPTGTADPFGYRRQALGIVSILLKSGISITISEICRVVIKHLKEKMEFNEEEVHRTVLEFFKTRLSGVLYADGFPKEFVDAVITVDSLNPVEIKDKINSLVLISKQERFNNLLLAYKRIVNILGNNEFFEISEDKLVEEAEKNLYIAFLNAEKQCGDKLHQKKYVEAVEELFNLIEPVNNFFDTVLIMSEDIMLRQNRLALLNNLKKLFLQFADFSKLPIKNTEVQK